MSGPATTATGVRRLNGFWSAVCGCELVETPAAITAETLGDASREAFRRPPRQYGLRRPRELVDLDGRFRQFSYDGRSFVAKRSPAADAVREARQARLARRRLRSTPWLMPLVPWVVRGGPADTRTLVAEEMGPSLSSHDQPVSVLVPWDTLLATIRVLLDQGIEWSGLLPRNVLFGDGSDLVLVDWEDCRFHEEAAPLRTVGDLTLLFWSIGWAGHYGLDASRFRRLLTESLSLTAVTQPLDGFERAYAAMFPTPCDPDLVRHRCSAATTVTESVDTETAAARSADSSSPPLTAAEMGHLLDELLPRHLSVLYTFAAQALVESAGVARYRSVVDRLTQTLVLATPCEGVQDAVRLRAIRRLLVTVLVALLLDDVPPAAAKPATTTHVFIDELVSRSPSVAWLWSAGSDTSLDRLLNTAANRLGIPGGPFRVAHAPGGPVVRDGAGGAAASGLQHLCAELLDLRGDSG
jgi:hypothetical protein